MSEWWRCCDRSTIDLYDASNYKNLRTINIEYDETTDLIVVPADSARTPATQP